MKKINKILTALGLSNDLGDQQGSTYVLLTRRLVRATALTVSCMMATPSFAQPLNCDGGYWNGSAWVCPQQLPGGGDPWGWPTNPNGSGPPINGEGCSPADPNCFSDDGDDGGEPESPPDAQACFDIAGDQPQMCNTDPGGEADLDYSEWINANMGSILGDLTIPCTTGCFWSNNYPNTSSDMVFDVISAFATSYYTTFDYISARSSIWDTLVQPCIGAYWADPYASAAQDDLADCATNQADFLYSMTPLTTGSATQWAAGLSLRTPWGASLSFSVKDNFIHENWVQTLLNKVEADRTCHLWYEALDDANCTQP